MAWFTGDELFTCKINGETKESARQLPSAHGPGRPEWTRDGTKNRDFGIVVMKSLTHGRDENAIHH
jgi:hypothetical protein